MRVVTFLLVCIGTWFYSEAAIGVDNWGIDTLVNYPPGQGRKEVPVKPDDIGVSVPIAVQCQCADADPRGEEDQLVTVDCFYQRLFGNCNEEFMFDADADVSPNGFCQISCSRCNCCSPPADVIQSLGGGRFLQALEAAQPSTVELFDHPGYMNTILVPTDAAWDAALEIYGPQLTQPAVLQQIVKFHILPPEPVRRGLWTTPFMSLGPKLYTAYDGPSTLSVERFPLPATVTAEGGLTGFQIKGPINSATVVQSDAMSCKSYITLIDSVLLPFDPTKFPPEEWLQPSAAVGVEGCFVQANGMITGQTLVQGDANIQVSAGDCCDACKSNSECNAWLYCSQKGGCTMPEGKVYQFGFCELKRSAEVANRQPADYSDFSTLTVPFMSGFIPLMDGPITAATTPDVVSSPASFRLSDSPMAESTAQPLVAATAGDR